MGINSGFKGLKVRAKKYSSTLFLTSALDGLGGQRHDAAAVSPGMTRCLSYKKLGEPLGRFGWARKISPPPGFDPRTIRVIYEKQREGQDSEECI